MPMNLEHRKTAAGVALCLLAVLAWFSPWWLGGKNLAPLDLVHTMMSPWRSGHDGGFAKNHIVSDGVDQYLVYRMIAEKSYRDEGWVGWSSLTYGGTAQYANTMALYYDWTMQLHRWFGFWTAWHLGLLCQVFIAASGMLMFLRGRSIHLVWAVGGALAYAANSQFVTWIYHRWALGSFCWVPWIAWAIDHCRRGSVRFHAAVPVFIALAFLGGTLQHASLVVLAVAAIWAEEAMAAPRAMGPQFRLAGRYAAWGIAGCGLAAMMFIPCADAFLTSNQLGLHTGMHGNASNGIYPQGWLQPLFNLAAYPFQFFPSVLGRCDSMDVLKLFKSELFYVAYFGSLPVLIALLATWRKDSPALARILIGCGLLLPLTPLVRLLYQRLFLLFILGGILAFVHFMQHATAGMRLAVFRITAIIAGICVLPWTLASVILSLNPSFMNAIRTKILTEGRKSSFGYFDEWIAGRAERFIGDLSIWSPQQCIPLLFLAVALAGLRLTASRHAGRKHAGSVMVVAAVFLEVTLFASRWVTWCDPSRYPLFPETAETRALEQFVGNAGRTTTLIHPSAHMALTPFVPNTLAAYGIAAIGGYDSIIPKGMILPNESPDDASRLGRLGVSHLITWHGNPDVPATWNHVWSSPAMILYENPMRVEPVAGFRNDHEKNAFFAGGACKATPVKTIRKLENSRVYEVPPGIEWIRISENQADGWEYKTGDTEPWRPVLRAPDASMLVQTAGSSAETTLQLRYAPPLRMVGFAVSAFSFILVMSIQAGLLLRHGKTGVPSLSGNAAKFH